MTKVKYIANELLTNSKSVKFDSMIELVREDKENIYVLLDVIPSAEHTYNDFHNGYAYNKNGEFLWQIGQREISDKDVYTLISLKDEKLFANDFSGRRYIVDKVSGIPSNMQIVK